MYYKSNFNEGIVTITLLALKSAGERKLGSCMPFILQQPFITTHTSAYIEKRNKNTFLIICADVLFPRENFYGFASFVDISRYLSSLYFLQTRTCFWRCGSKKQKTHPRIQYNSSVEKSNNNLFLYIENLYYLHGYLIGIDTKFRCGCKWF